MTKNLDLSALLDFYDYHVEKSKTHATAINAVLGEDLAIFLMTHYFEHDGYKVSLKKPCTQGGARGHRLDIWFALEKENKKDIFQVEIKNWSAHSVGGIRVDKDFTEDSMVSHRKRVWKKRFNVERKVPAEKASEKVLTKMKIHDDFIEYQEHKALLCFWEPMHPEGKPDAFFEVPVNSESFAVMSVFSMSNYVSILLGQDIRTLEVEMKEADARVDWLQKLYS